MRMLAEVLVASSFILSEVNKLLRLYYPCH